jgi:hypothetical protein
MHTHQIRHNRSTPLHNQLHGRFFDLFRINQKLFQHGQTTNFRVNSDDGISRELKRLETVA